MSTAPRSRNVVRKTRNEDHQYSNDGGPGSSRRIHVPLGRYDQADSVSLARNRLPYGPNIEKSTYGDKSLSKTCLTALSCSVVGSISSFGSAPRVLTYLSYILRISRPGIRTSSDSMEVSISTESLMRASAKGSGGAAGAEMANVVPTVPTGTTSSLAGSCLRRRAMRRTDVNCPRSMAEMARVPTTNASMTLFHSLELMKTKSRMFGSPPPSAVMTASMNGLVDPIHLKISSTVRILANSSQVGSSPGKPTPGAVCGNDMACGEIGVLACN